MELLIKRGRLRRLRGARDGETVGDKLDLRPEMMTMFSKTQSMDSLFARLSENIAAHCSRVQSMDLGMATLAVFSRQTHSAIRHDVVEADVLQRAPLSGLKRPARQTEVAIANHSYVGATLIA